MHKVTSTKYTFNDNLTYFIGPNGAGKSTILQAVQLGLLGYVPGLPKTSESIFSHANGPVMSVTVDLDDNGSDISITRSWMKSGSSVKSTTNISPATLSESYVSEAIGDMELPIFDFNEFNSMTSNKLKDWFINFLPKSDSEIDWENQFRSSLQNEGLTIRDDFLSDVLSEIPDTLAGVEQVRAVNEMLKTKQSFVKGQLASAESTVQSLIFYDDADMSLNIEEIDSKIKELSDLRVELTKYESYINSALSSKQSAEARIKEVETLITLDSDDIELCKAELSKIQTEFDSISEEIANARVNWQTAQKNYSAMLSEEVKDQCPLLNCPCDKLDDLKASHEAGLKSAEESVAAAKSTFDKVEKEYNKLNAKRLEINARYTSALTHSEQQKAAEAELSTLKQMITNADTMLAAPRPTEKSQEDIISEINTLTEQGRKHRANEEYNRLIDKFTKDKFDRQSEFEALKVWIKLTDTNGLQTKLMDSVFEEFEAKLTSTLKNMFSDESASAKFNLVSKANSFSFGIIRNSQYVKYDLLSSGEKCLYMTAMLVTLLKESDTSLKLILVDDLLDHLDDANAEKFFNAAKSIKDVQFILAGVKQANNSEFIVEV